eukprot:Skav204868  [mRNA]  locus=scaffold1679:71464:72517:- [translate_table: standard]
MLDQLGADTGLRSLGAQVRDGQLNINMASRNLDDAGIEKWCEWADECLPDFVQNKRLPRREADGFLLCPLVAWRCFVMLRDAS